MPYWLETFTTTGVINPATGLPTLTASQSAEIVSLLSAGTFFGRGLHGWSHTADSLDRHSAIRCWTFRRGLWGGHDLGQHPAISERDSAQVVSYDGTRYCCLVETAADLVA